MSFDEQILRKRNPPTVTRTEEKLPTASNAVVIPVRVDFLLIDGSEPALAEAKAEFSRLPYNDGRKDVNSEFGYINENFISQPFQNNNLVLPAGLHLHWALPDAYTKGRVTETGSDKLVTHTKVPDRWIINRKKNNEVERSWIVESNYLHPEGKENKYHSIAYPTDIKKTGQPFRYMGRSYCFFDKNQTIKTEIPAHPQLPEYFNNLTAAGYGEPSFAAFFPSCKSVFGFYDRDIRTKEDLKGTEYEVLGWYGNINNDPLRVAELVPAPGGLAFDGTDDLVMVNSIGATVDKYSAEIWIKPDETGKSEAQCILYVPDRGINLWLHSNGKIGHLYFTRDGRNMVHVLTTEPIKWGEWSHIAVTNDGLNHATYINGELKALEYSGGEPPEANDKNPKLGIILDSFALGAVPDPQLPEYFFKGCMSRFCIWNEVRTPEQIYANMRTDHKVPQPNLLIYYKFNHGIPGADNLQHNMIVDSSGNSKHGGLVKFNLAGATSNWTGGPLSTDQKKIIKEKFDLDLSTADAMLSDSLSLVTFCYGTLSFEKVTDKGPFQPPVIVVGNTGSEAIMKWMQVKVAPELQTDDENSKALKGAKIKALKFVTSFSHKPTSDHHHEISEAHEKSFHPVSGGHLWKIKMEDATGGSGKVREITIDLPNEFAYLINELNVLQQVEDKHHDELRSLREQLYADWCKYMISSYHPDIEKDLPHPDDIRSFIEGHSFQEIEEKQKEIDDSKKETEERLKMINTIIEQFNAGNKSIVGKLEGEKFFASGANISADNDLNGRNVFKGTWTSDPEMKVENFYAISFWVLVNSHQTNTSANLIKLKPINASEDDVYQNAAINFSTVGNYWQHIYINGKSLNPFESVEWRDLPKDQWTHIYMAGTARLIEPINITLLDKLSGTLGGVRVYNDALTPMEIFQDANMLQLKLLTIVKDKGPRFWQPTEPVVMIQGDIAEPTDRHSNGSNLPCLLFSPGTIDAIDISGFDFYIPYDQERFLKKLVTLSGITSTINRLTEAFPEIKDAIINSPDTYKPWNPIMLEWEVAMLPLADESGASQYKISSDIINRNYILENGHPGLSSPPNHTIKKEAQKILRGTTILTPHAKFKKIATIEKYLEDLTEDGDDWKKFLTVKQISFNPFLNEQGKADKIKINEISNTIADKEADNISIAIKAHKLLDDTHFLSQSLGGFNASMRMLHQAFQLPIADPLGFDDDQVFAAKVKNKVDKESKFSPLPLFEFDNVRAGELKIMRLNIIDSFGQIINVYDENKEQFLLFSNEMSNGKLAPRISQPARINFRWLSANDNKVEMNDHPASSPVCGWLVANNPDDSIMVFDQDGNSLGSIENQNSKAIWRSTPGFHHPVSFMQIGNEHLRNVIARLMDTPDLSAMIDLLEMTLDRIDPDNFSHHTDTVMLISRPIAIVRASIGLEVKGNFAINQDWTTFESDLRNYFTKNESKRTTNDWEKIKFPIRIGEQIKLNDGLIGYWLDDNIFHSVIEKHDNEISEFLGSATNSKGYDAKAPDINLSFEDRAVEVTMLIDPRAPVHATSGILPVKPISIPDDQFKSSLKKMSMTFFTRPLLMSSTNIQIPLPDEPGYNWSWLVQADNKWIETSTIGVAHKETFVKAFKNGDEIWKKLIESGWIEETYNNKANVIPKNHRKSTKDNIDQVIAQQLERIEQMLDAGHINDPEYIPNLTATNVIKEGWLRLTPDE